MVINKLIICDSGVYVGVLSGVHLLQLWFIVHMLTYSHLLCGSGCVCGLSLSVHVHEHFDCLIFRGSTASISSKLISECGYD